MTSSSTQSERSLQPIVRVLTTGSTKTRTERSPACAGPSDAGPHGQMTEPPAEAAAIIAHRALAFEPARASCHAIVMSTPRHCRRLLLLVCASVLSFEPDRAAAECALLSSQAADRRDRPCLLAGYVRDCLEVVVVVAEADAGEFCDGGDHEVGWFCLAVFS